MIREWFERKLPLMTYHGKPMEQVMSRQMVEDLYHFEGNAQAFRLVTKLHFLVDERGMNLTYALLSTIVKYPVPSTGIDLDSGDIKTRKMGYYLADEKMFREIERETGMNGCRHPLTFILEAADDIAYKTADIEDAFVKGYLSYHTLLEELKELQMMYHQETNIFRPADKLEELYFRGKEMHVANPEEYAVKNWIIRVQGFVINCATYGFTSNYDAIMKGEYKYDLFHGTYCERLMQLLGDLAYREVFTSEPIYRMEVTESVMLSDLLNKFMTAIIKYDDPSQKLNSMDLRIVSFISDNYTRAYHGQAEGKTEAEKLYLRILLVTDYICGMTDSYAMRLYQEMRGMFLSGTE